MSEGDKDGRASPRDEKQSAAWAEVFDAQKSVIYMLVATLLEIKDDRGRYNFGGKLVRVVDGALKKLPPGLVERVRGEANTNPAAGRKDK